MRQEAATLRAIQDWLDMKKMLYVRINPISPVGPGRWRKVRETQLGAPDLIVFPHGRAVCVEVKSAKGKLSPRQETWKWRAFKNGLSYIVVRSIGDFLYELELLPCGVTPA